MAAARLEEALLRDGEPVPVDEIRIAIVPERQFRWSLHSRGEEIFAGMGDAGMAQATAELVNSQLGVPPTVGMPRPSHN